MSPPIANRPHPTPTARPPKRRDDVKKLPATTRSGAEPRTTAKTRRPLTADPRHARRRQVHPTSSSIVAAPPSSDPKHLPDLQALHELPFHEYVRTSNRRPTRAAPVGGLKGGQGVRATPAMMSRIRGGAARFPAVELGREGPREWRNRVTPLLPRRGGRGLSRG